MTLGFKPAILFAMLPTLSDSSCPGCLARDAIIVELQRQMQQMQQQIEALQERMARAEKNSSNSSKPPSSDIVKPPKLALKGGKKRGQGGQPGHVKHERIFHLDDADIIHNHRLDCCPKCACSTLIDLPDQTRTQYQYELADQP
ncbi:MAG TPA: hypothetical protein EYG11_09725, partial [Candidatus Latescibacteria bacterium]|nr:hypothetical protein [Candidatus Latescibacterota bacterium]